MIFDILSESDEVIKKFEKKRLYDEIQQNAKKDKREFVYHESQIIFKKDEVRPF